MDIREIIEEAKKVEAEERRLLSLIARMEMAFAKEDASGEVDWDKRYGQMQTYNLTKGFKLSDVRKRLGNLLTLIYPEVWKLWFRVADLKEASEEEYPFYSTVNEQAVWVSDTLQRCLPEADYKALEEAHYQPLFPRVEEPQEASDPLAAYQSAGRKAKKPQAVGVKHKPQQGYGDSGLLFEEIRG